MLAFKSDLLLLDRAFGRRSLKNPSALELLLGLPQQRGRLTAATIAISHIRRQHTLPFRVVILVLLLNLLHHEPTRDLTVTHQVDESDVFVNFLLLKFTYVLVSPWQYMIPKALTDRKQANVGILRIPSQLTCVDDSDWRSDFRCRELDGSGDNCHPSRVKRG